MSAFHESGGQAGRQFVNNVGAEGVRHTSGPREANVTDPNVARDPERATREVEHLPQTLSRERSLSHNYTRVRNEHVRARVYPSTPPRTQVDHTRGRTTATALQKGERRLEVKGVNSRSSTQLPSFTFTHFVLFTS